jgi:hypothetical protein
MEAERQQAMADILYTHRIAKLIEEFVIGAGLSVHVSDENTSAKLQPLLPSIRQIAQSLNVEMTDRKEGGATLISFRRKS